MRKSINPRALDIQGRFFVALETAIRLGAFSGLQEFCARNSLNRTKYSRLRNSTEKELAEMTYKCIDIDALAALCEDFGVSAEWLLLGRGKMLKRESS